MLILTGRDFPVLERLADALSAAGRSFVRVDLPSPLRQDEPGLFEAAIKRQATGIVLVESLPRPGDMAPAGDKELFAEALRATHAPGFSLLVVVTSRSEDDDALDALRRSGVPYVILRAPAVVDVGARANLKGRKVLIPEPIADGMKTPPVEHLVRKVLRALTEEELVGRTLSVEFADSEVWVRLLEEKGARPLKVGPLRARVGRFLGQLALSDLQVNAAESASPSCMF